MIAAEQRPLRVVVCGTTFGQIYLSSLAAPDQSFELTGILATGSLRSQRLAAQYRVPLYRDPSEVPADTDIACVVVRSAAMGGRGTDIARQLMAKGIHVLQEHPVHHDELLECLADAVRYRVVYKVNSFYPQLEPVRRFVELSRRLLAREPALFVDAACAVQVSFPLFDILGRVLGSVQPWQLTALALAPESGAPPAVFQSLAGCVGGVPITLRIQNQTDPADPDNSLHLLHRVCLGTASGNLTLLNTHGPLYWSPRLHVSARSRGSLDAHATEADELDASSASRLATDDPLPSFRDILMRMWPNAITSALQELRMAISSREDPRRRGQYYLALCRLWQESTSRLGYPEPICGLEGRKTEADDLWRAGRAGDFA